MLNIKTETAVFKAENKNGEWLLNDIPAQADWQQIGENKFHVIYKNGSYTVELLDKNETGKEFTIAVNGIKHQLSASDEFDELLKKLGLDKLASNKVNDIKAPMPGMVLRIQVKEGDAIKKGDSILVLEAMKMENVIKAAGDGVVKKINISEKTVVEKNQVMVVLE